VPLALVVSGCGPAPGSAGFARSVAVCPPWSPGIAAAPSTATIPALPPDSARCNSVGVLAGDESAARILSADSAACAAGVPIASAGQALDFRDGL